MQRFVVQVFFFIAQVSFLALCALLEPKLAHAEKLSDWYTWTLPDRGGRLGIKYHDATYNWEDGSKSAVAIIDEVARGGPLHYNNVFVGDAVLTVNGHTFESTTGMIRYVRNYQPGRKVPVFVVSKSSDYKLGYELVITLVSDDVVTSATYISPVMPPPPPPQPSFGGSSQLTPQQAAICSQLDGEQAQLNVEVNSLISDYPFMKSALGCYRREGASFGCDFVACRLINNAPFGSGDCTQDWTRRAGPLGARQKSIDERRSANSCWRGGTSEEAVMPQ